MLVRKAEPPFYRRDLIKRCVKLLLDLHGASQEPDLEHIGRPLSFHEVQFEVYG